MHVTFSGAAREVTGSCHLLTVGEHTVALDCGMFQGHRAEAREKNVRLPFPPEQLSAIVLSHAHIDHAGRLPLLTRRGFTGTIWATAASRDLCAIMLADSAHIQEKDAEYLRRHGREAVEPLYALADIGRWELPIIRDPQPPKEADCVIMESTYGNRDHPPIEDMRERLASIVRETAARGGRVLIPAFAVGRTQEIVYDLHALARDKRIPAIPIYIDSPLAVDVTSVFALHPETFDRTEGLVQLVQELFHFDLLHYTRDVVDSKALNTQRGPMIIISPSGMAEVGRILHHLRNGASDPRNTILIAGFQAAHTLGRRIVERRPTLRILGDDIPLRARVEVLNGYSAHGDRTELTRWVDAVRAASGRVPPVWLVHGEPPSQEALAGRLRERGYDVHIPAPGDRAPF